MASNKILERMIFVSIVYCKSIITTSNYTPHLIIIGCGDSVIPADSWNFKLSIFGWNPCNKYVVWRIFGKYCFGNLVTLTSVPVMLNCLIVAFAVYEYTTNFGLGSL